MAVMSGRHRGLYLLLPLHEHTPKIREVVAFKAYSFLPLKPRSSRLQFLPTQRALPLTLAIVAWSLHYLKHTDSALPGNYYADSISHDTIDSVISR